jgi:hypothetical protein
VLAVHSDKEHIHTHIIVNNTNVYNGLSFTYEENQGGRRERAWAKLRAVSDDLCREHNLSVIAEPEKGHSVSHFEHDMQKQGKSWKDKFRARIAEVAFYSKSFDDFLDKYPESGIEVSYTPTKKVKLKFRLKDEGQQRFTRADTLGEDYTAERIAKQIEQMQKGRTALERLAEKKNAEKPTPAVTPKIEPKPTATAPTKPTISEPTSNLSVMTEEEYIKILEEQDRQAQAEKAAKKAAEVDPWAEIRGMGRSAEIIADLESSGIKSLDELREFFWNTPHEDDNTKELAALRKQYRAIDTLIAKIQHRDKLEPIYKEYQAKKGWAQSRFKKKNLAKIEDYEETVAYIKKHGKPFIVDGELMPIYDLMDKSNKLKSKCNEISPKHEAFVTKRDTAHKYVTKVKSYLAEQHNKREREKSRQRTQTKHKKNYLE